MFHITSVCNNTFHNNTCNHTHVHTPSSSLHTTPQPHQYTPLLITLNHILLSTHHQSATVHNFSKCDDFAHARARTRTLNSHAPTHTSPAHSILKILLCFPLLVCSSSLLLPLVPSRSSHVLCSLSPLFSSPLIFLFSPPSPSNVFSLCHDEGDRDEWTQTWVQMMMTGRNRPTWAQEVLVVEG